MKWLMALKNCLSWRKRVTGKYLPWDGGYRVCMCEMEGKLVLGNVLWWRDGCLKHRMTEVQS